MGENVSGRGKCVAGSIDRPATCFLAAAQAIVRWGPKRGGVAVWAAC